MTLVTMSFGSQARELTHPTSEDAVPLFRDEIRYFTRSGIIPLLQVACSVGGYVEVVRVCAAQRVSLT
jgi:hypothetical protein